jgi:hypothetical protein
MVELGAMTEVAKALEALAEDARGRVLAWANARFLATGTAPLAVGKRGKDQGSESGAAAESRGTSISDFSDIADFYHACAPETDAEKALVISSWFQVVQGVDGIDTFKVNSVLKHLGYGIGNATRAFDQLMSQRPAPVIQLRKAGTTRQARKTFRVTDAGLKRIGQMLNATSNDMD